jgi:hypothetical protein
VGRPGNTGTTEGFQEERKKYCHSAEKTHSLPHSIFQRHNIIILKSHSNAFRPSIIRPSPCSAGEWEEMMKDLRMSGGRDAQKPHP